MKEDLMKLSEEELTSLIEKVQRQILKQKLINEKKKIIISKL